MEFLKKIKLKIVLTSFKLYNLEPKQQAKKDQRKNIKHNIYIVKRCLTCDQSSPK